jgi:hypothetical protein
MNFLTTPWESVSIVVWQKPSEPPPAGIDVLLWARPLDDTLTYLPRPYVAQVEGYQNGQYDWIWLEDGIAHLMRLEYYELIAWCEIPKPPTTEKQP